MESKSLFVLAVILGCAFQAHAATTSNGATLNNLEESKLRDARQALNQAQNQLQQNLVSALTNLANATAQAGTNVSRAANVLMRGMIQNSFSLAGVVGYMPRLILLDGPTQFVETLRLVRNNQIRLPNDVDSAIDTLIAFANQQRDSGIGNNFTPVVTFLPNLFTGVGDFLTTVIDSVFTVIAN
ncbi:unnamed protein product [Allacma fusca]|uniref:Uncharacterized protein n=1 Tax=Allacma fusca TaxID=39272 RepID=A0A8J2KD12_9HEXA|nr:unnamed protein product [Allacma fusca]